MRKLILFLLTSFLLFSCESEPTGESYLNKMKKYRYKINVTFSDKETSPLKKEDLRDFKTLDFYPVDTNYRIKAKVERAKHESFMEMETNSKKKVKYKVYGKAVFTLNGKEHSLNLYSYERMNFTGEFPDKLFLPFYDTTNGKETYDGGRYIDVEFPKKKMVTIDFNKAYNPYCDYNDKYVCPIVPSVNTLNIPIPAGVKDYKNPK